MIRAPQHLSRSRQHGGFTLIEAALVSLLMALLAVLVSGAWSGLGRPLADLMARCRVTNEANLALATLARDCGGSLPATLGPLEQGRLVGHLLVANSELWLCFDGGANDGLPDWTAPDTVIRYRVESGKLIRRNDNLGTDFVAARNVDALELMDLGTGVQIRLRFKYRNITRTYTVVAKNP